MREKRKSKKLKAKSLKWGGSTSNFFLLISIVLFSLIGCTNADRSQEHVTYTCPMHPTVVSDQPGNCPVCGMSLVRKGVAGEDVEVTEDLAKLINSQNESVIAAVSTIKGEYKSQPVSFQLQGIVTYDTRNIFAIPARIGGRLEKVYLKFPFQTVKKGQKVAEIYSPELLAAQRELLFILDNDSQNELLINASREKLQRLGVSNAQVNALIQRKEPLNTFAIFSPYDGYVMSEAQEAPVAPLSSSTSPESNDAMASPVSGSTSSNQSLIREGSYVTAGQSLFRIVNTSALRIELNVPSTIVGEVKKGQLLMLDFGDGETQSATIDFIQPFFSEGQTFLTIRVFAHHLETAHIGHLVNATLTHVSNEALWVPKAALLDLGVDKIVFVKDKGVLKPRKVVIGLQAKGAVEIIQGLSTADEIAANAQFLVDSESFIKTQH